MDDFSAAAASASGTDDNSSKENESAAPEQSASFSDCPSPPSSPLPPRSLFTSRGWDLVFPSSHEECSSDCDCRGAEACIGSAVSGALGRCVMAQGVCGGGGGYARNLFKKIMVISTSAAGNACSGGSVCD